MRKNLKVRDAFITIIILKKRYIIIKNITLIAMLERIKKILKKNDL